jgi:isoquinoline 1-oxidoreductase beta subunit
MIDRRDFVKLTGLSLALVLTEGGFKIIKGAQEEIINPVLWANITKDNHLVLLVNKSEMGQGVWTGLAMLVADELDFPWERVRVRSAPAGPQYIDRKLGMQLTGGSTSVRNMYDFLRQLGATMREMIINYASEEWKVPMERLKAKEGYVFGNGKRASYGELWEGAIKLPIPHKVKLKEPSEFKYIGKNIPRIDAKEKVDGSAIFGIDVRLKDMVYAVVERPPAFGCKLKGFDPSRAKQVEGVIDVFAISTGVAVCGRDFYSAQKGREGLNVEWTESPIEDFDDQKLARYYLNALNKAGAVARHDGNPEDVISKAKVKVESVYLLPYLYHATRM